MKQSQYNRGLLARPIMASWLVLFLLLLSGGAVLGQQESLVDQVLGTEQSTDEEGGGRSTIAVDTTTADDTEIEQRLLRILSEIDTMSGVTVDVSNSVVQLKGEVESAEARTEAQALGNSLEGVVKVDNQIEISRDVSQRVRTTWDRVRQLLQQIGSVLPVLVLAIAVFIAFWYAAGWIANRQTLWRKVAPNAFIATVIGSIFRLFVLLLGVLLALYLLDATSIIATVLGAAGIVGLALGFAVRDTVENFIASILLSIRQPFRMNDFVQIGEHQGSVARLTGRATILISPDGNQIRIPNAMVFKSIITNYTRHPMRRFELSVPVDESEDLALARRIADETMRTVPGVQNDPPPQVHIQSLGETIISLTILGWIDQRSHDLLKVQTASAVAIKTALRNAGITMPQSLHTITLIDKLDDNDFVQNSVNAVSSGADRDGADSPVNAAKKSGQAGTSSPETINDIIDTRVEPSERDVVTTQLAEEQRESQNLLTED